jgi:phosphoribosylanthranilate isomerase
MTRRADVEMAVRFGVDALGFIFVKESPRYISPEKVREITANVPPFVNTVGVFKNEDPALIHEIVQYCGLSVVQLHGSEPPEYSETISCEVIKAFQVHAELRPEHLEPYAGVIDAFLFDTYQKGTAGGTGETFDWQLLNKLAPPGPVILAGGIGPENVRAAILAVRPFAVDVNSRVELEAGIKDMEKVRALVEEIRKVDQGLGD